MSEDETNVVQLNVSTKLDMPVQKILEHALSEGLVEVVVAGWMPDGQLMLATSSGSGGTSLWLLERAKQRLMEEPDGS